MIEQKLIGDILKGDTLAFRDLLDLYEHRVYHFVKKLTNDVHLAEDITQETFLAVYKSLHTYDRSKAFSTWVFTIAKHKAFKMIKRTSQESMNTEVDMIHMEDSKADVLSQVIQAEEKMALLSAVDQLKVSYKDVIILRYFYGYSYQEISRTLGIPVKKVENRLRAGKHKLQALLSEEKGMVACYDY